MASEACFISFKYQRIRIPGNKLNVIVTYFLPLRSHPEEGGNGVAKVQKLQVK